MFAVNHANKELVGIIIIKVIRLGRPFLEIFFGFKSMVLFCFTFANRIVLLLERKHMQHLILMLVGMIGVLLMLLLLIQSYAEKGVTFEFLNSVCLQ